MISSRIVKDRRGRGNDPLLTFGIIIIVVAIIMALGGFFRLFSLSAIGESYKLQTADADITFYTMDKYFDRVGCQAEPNLGACSVEQIRVGIVAGCPTYQYYVTGWYNCDSDFQNNCEFGANCEQSYGYGKLFCSKHCTWGKQKLGNVYGGPDYEELNNCAWYVVVKDKQGNLVKEYSANTKYENWGKTPYYRDDISFKYEGTILNFVSDDYGIVQRRNDGSTIKGCIAVKFSAQDSDCMYNVCLGNDGADNGCENVMTKTCISDRIDGSGAEDITPPEEDGQCDFRCLWDRFVSWLKSLFG